jgi:hypothetical protein
VILSLSFWILSYRWLFITLACLYYVFTVFFTMGLLESCTWFFYHFVIFPKFCCVLFTNSRVLVDLPCVLVFCGAAQHSSSYGIVFLIVINLDMVFIKVRLSGSFISLVLYLDCLFLSLLPRG